MVEVAGGIRHQIGIHGFRLHQPCQPCQPPQRALAPRSRPPRLTQRSSCDPELGSGAPGHRWSTKTSKFTATLATDANVAQEGETLLCNNAVRIPAFAFHPGAAVQHPQSTDLYR